MKGKMIMGVLIGFLMISSIFGMVANYYSGNNNVRFGDFVYEVRNNIYFTDYEDKEIHFFRPSTELNTYEIPVEFIEWMKNTPLLEVTFNSSADDVKDTASIIADLSSQVFTTHKLYVSPGDINNNSENHISCSDAAPLIKVIQIKKDVTANLSYENDCLIIGYTSKEDLINFRDEMMYDFYGMN